MSEEMEKTAFSEVETTSEEPLVTSETTPDNETPSDIQLEPTQEEMERERLTAKAEQLQDEIEGLREQLKDKELELAEVKKALGITPFVEFKQSMAHGFKVMGDKLKEVQETETYQKTKTALSEGGKKVSDSMSAAGTKIKENETMKNIGEKTSTALKRTGTKIKETGTAIRESETLKNVGTKISTAAANIKGKVMGDGTTAEEQEGEVPNQEGETVVPDEPATKNE